MNRTVALTLILALLISTVAVGIRFVNLAIANFVPVIGYVKSPEGITYSVNEVPLIFIVDVNSILQKWLNIKITIVEMFYSLDGKANVTVPMTYSNDEDSEIYTAETVLSGLSEGSHTVMAYAKDQDGKVHSYEGDFAIDTTLPSISVLSVENKTYASPDVPLNFTLSESCAKMTYSLDGEENLTIGGNTTLSGLSNGSHNLTVYAEDSAGNIGASETITFSITEPSTMPFPTTLVIAVSVALAVVVCFGLLVYFKKRKR